MTNRQRIFLLTGAADINARNIRTAYAAGPDANKQFCAIRGWDRDGIYAKITDGMQPSGFHKIVIHLTNISLY